ncbi:hypothetical protein C2S53_006435 [Perilla frutescens var. hirtella]|uniref:Uncharacterized protein n=1 Tax=Perilla frutescens var. hirtella TaxID=608512 RepID=A0AAD4JF33_PERFH|nr:hypothetical protein C2S53_006435 [Perilla frutescens var. hirtella]
MVLLISSEVAAARELTQTSSNSNTDASKESEDNCGITCCFGCCGISDSGASCHCCTQPINLHT